MRARTLKPGFFKNEYLCELGPEAMLLFAGLWTLADRAGRLEDRPKRIKAEIFPYTDCDVDGLLNALTGAQFIVRYIVNGQRYIAMPTWSKHQCPHIKEPASQIPPPDEHGVSIMPEQCEHDTSPVQKPPTTLPPYHPTTGGGCVPRMAVAAQPELSPPAQLDGFADLRAAVEAAIPPNTFTPDDWGKAYYFWKKLDIEQRLTARQNYLDRIADGHENLTFLTPQRVLAGTEWKRRPPPPVKTRSELADEELERRINAREEARRKGIPCAGN